MSRVRERSRRRPLCPAGTNAGSEAPARGEMPCICVAWGTCHLPMSKGLTGRWVSGFVLAREVAHAASITARVPPLEWALLSGGTPSPFSLQLAGRDLVG